MAVPVEEGTLNALRGVTSSTTRLTKPLIIKVYVSSLKDEFREERRMLLELVGPELQSMYDDRQIEIEIIDMHFGTGPMDRLMLDQDPYLIHDYLDEIKSCHRVSKSVFFIALVGEKIGRMCLPTHLKGEIFLSIVNKCDSEERVLINKWYGRYTDEDGLKHYALKEDYRNLPFEKWNHEYLRLLELMEKCLSDLQQSSTKDKTFTNDIRKLRMTQMEREVQKALEFSNDKIISVFREWSSHSNPPDIETRERLRGLKDILTLNLPSDNYTTLIVPGKSEKHEIDADLEDHESYLSKFKNKIFDKMRNLIEEHIANDPDVIKGRKKTVQEVFHEHSTHLRFLNDHIESESLISSQIPDRLRKNIMQNYRAGSRHAPYFIFGGHGSGKSTLIAKLYTDVKNWFPVEHNTKLHRIIRFASATPRSAYNLELLRVICQQISIIFNIPEGYLPKDASFDPLYINNWFQNLLRRCEDSNNEILFVFIDDLHKLHPLDRDIDAALSWLPISLPWNVYIICSTTTPIDQLRFTTIQKDRFKSTECHFDLSLDINRTIIRMQDNEIPFEELVVRKFVYLEEKYGHKGFGRLAAYITCSEYGLSETELLELLMPCDNPEELIETHNGNFNFSTFVKIRNEMGLLIREKMMSGKILIGWRHRFCAEIAKSRYMDPNSTRIMHTEIASIFFNHDMEESDETSSVKTDNTAVSHVEKDRDTESNRKPSHQDDTSTFYNPIAADVSYSIRHVEESWHHLMRSDDTAKFKQIAVCNFDFLLAAVQTVSISYLRCLIEHVRCYILDRDIELIYYTILKSSDVLTRDPMQLGAQLISWLRPISEHDENDNSLLSITVRSATAWCDGYTVPLLVPMTGWLPPPLPPGIKTMAATGTGPIRDIALAPSKQHLLLPNKCGDVQLWHIMSNTLVHIFSGHNAPVTCMVVPPQSDLLITGSEDSSVIVWDVETREMKAKIGEHKGSVTCVTAGMDNTLAISGSEDSTIIIYRIETGRMLQRIVHHRAAVTSVRVSNVCDVLISSSRDKLICLWSLEDYTLLNSVQMQSPVLRMDISCDSVFLLAHCEDNGLYLRTLATGTELHYLKGHKSKVRSITIAKDGQRAIIGCDDTRALIFDMHSGKLVRSLPPNPGAVTAVYVMDNDDFLITVGGNKITFYSFRNEELHVHPYSHNHRRKRSLKRLQSQRSPGSTTLPPITCFDISRDSQLAAIASGKYVHVMQTNTPEYQSTLDGHLSAVTCVSFAPNGEFLVSGSEDKIVHVWGLALGLISSSFKDHNSTITCVVFLMDSRRVISSDREGFLHVWLAESATVLQTVQGPYKSLLCTNNMKFAVCTNGDNSLKIWSLTREDEKYTVSHSDEITCFAITADSLFVITGSRDMSLKVWQATGGKLAQVLVGHSKAVTCVAVSVTNKSQVISGSKDCNLIVWDIHTGEEIHTLAGHLGQVNCVKVSADGTTAVSSSDDKTLIVWETKRGLALTSLNLHVPIIRFDISLECSRILVQLVDSFNLPVICLHNTPATYVKLPTYSAPARDVEDLRPQGPKRQMKRLLKKEVSLDTYTWQKKYGHLTSSVMMAQVDERLKRRFSVSASMEEISKIAEMKTLTSQTNLGPEQAALAQSQHFDQLEALWNKRSPPRRRQNRCLSRQTSLVEDRLESSDDDEYQDERSGMSSSTKTLNNSIQSNGLMRLRPLSLPTDAWKCCSLDIPIPTNTTIRPISIKSLSNHSNVNANDNANVSGKFNEHCAQQPDLVRDLLDQSKQNDCKCHSYSKLRNFFAWKKRRNPINSCRHSVELCENTAARTADTQNDLSKCNQNVNGCDGIEIGIGQHQHLHKSKSLHKHFKFSKIFQRNGNKNCRILSECNCSNSPDYKNVKCRKARISSSCIAQ